MKCHRIVQGYLAPCCIALLLLYSPVFGQSQNSQDTEAQDEKQQVQAEEKLPRYEEAGSFYLGFRLVDIDVLSRVAEYEDDDSSLVFGADVIACPLPHRYHIHGEYLGENSYYGDVGYAYRDLLLFRSIFVGVHHNLDHYHYLYPSSSGATTYQDRNVWDENYLDFYKNDLLLRLKAPDYPFHAFFKNRYIKREGGIEERFMAGTIGRLVKTSQTRNVDWDSQDITLGLNSHLGPLEVEYAHERSEFDPGPDSVLYDYYPDSMLGSSADTYPHNVIPETESYANSLKFHSSYTGQIVASATFSSGSAKNNYSFTEAESWKAAFDLRWIPDPRASFSLRYRHNELDKDNPAEVVAQGLVNTNTYTVRPLVSTRSDLFTLAARYRPLTRLTLIGKYELELRDRSDVEEWVVLPEESEIHKINLTAHARPLQSLKLKLVYDFSKTDNPAYNIEPDHQNKIRLHATYTPLTWLTALFDYTLSESSRDNLRYYNSMAAEVYEQGDRAGHKDHILGSLACVLSPDATLTASWNYNRRKVEQDLAHADRSITGLPYYDRHAPYEDKSNTWTVSLYYQLRKDITLTADMAFIKAKGEYLSGVPVEEGVALGSFSDMDYEETELSAEVTKKILRDWEVGLKTKFGYYHDELDASGPEHLDGELYITTLTLKRFF